MHERNAGGWVLVALVFVSVLAFALHRLLAYDVWWQIAAGEWIASNGLPVTDPFSYAFPGREWIEPRWLFCLLVFGVFDVGGANALILLQALLLTASFALLLACGSSRVVWAAAAGSVLALAGWERFLVRPELTSFLALAAILLALTRWRRGASVAWIALLPVIQVVWCNAHTLWVLGPATLWIVLLGESAQRYLPSSLPAGSAPAEALGSARLRTLFYVTLLTSLAALINPYFLRGALFPFLLFQEIGPQHVLGREIAEFHGPLSPLHLRVDPRTLGYLATALLSFLAFVANRRRLSTARLLLWGAFLVLSLRAQRNVALFGFIAAWCTILNLTEWHEHRASRAAPRVLVVVLSIVLLALPPLIVSDGLYRVQGLSRRFGLGVSDLRFPVRALEFARTRGLPGPLLHSLGDGGYVLFDGGPKSAYIDGRLEVYGGDVLGPAIDLTRSGRGLDELIEAHDVHTALVRNDRRHRGLLQTLEHSPAWVPVYYDHLHQLYLRRTPETHELAGRLAIDWSDPPLFDVGRPGRVVGTDRRTTFPLGFGEDHEAELLGSFFAGVGNYALARGYFERAHAADRRDVQTLLHLGLIYRASGRQEEAAVLLDRVPRSTLDRPDVLELDGQLHLWARDPAGALERFQRALERGGSRPALRLSLARAAIAADRLDLGRQTLEDLLAEDPNLHEAWNLRGALELKRQRPDLARKHFERSLSIRPDQPRVRAILDDIREEPR